MSDEYPMAHKVKRPFPWIGSATHEAGSRPFWERQQRRIAEAAQAQTDEAKRKVTPIKSKQAK